MKNLIKAVISVMNDVKGIEKSMTVGTGQMSYKGVPDKEVKKILGQSMAKNGLCILPTGIKPSIKIERWEEPDYSGKIKTKQSVFTEVISTYLLMHESGECQEISGYGHGVDSQDKGAGKATTYALKYALLYSLQSSTLIQPAHLTSFLLQYGSLEVGIDNFPLLRIVEVECIHSTLSAIPYKTEENIINALEWIFLKQKQEWYQIFVEFIDNTISVYEDQQK
jgi:hypothetical protein